MLKRISLCVLLLCSGCASAPTTQTIQVVDDLNRNVAIPLEPTQVIPLLASHADLWQIAGGDIYATSQESINQNVVDAQVPVVANGKEISSEYLLSLQPDLVILSTDYPEHQKFAELLSEFQIPNLVITLDTFDDYLRNLQLFTQITNQPQYYNEYGVKQELKINKLVDQAQSKEAPSILLLRAFSTGVKARVEDHFVGGMLAQLHTTNIAHLAPILLDELSLETILQENPEHIFITMMGDYDKAVAYVEQELQSHPVWKHLDAVKQNNVHYLPQDLFHYKPNKQWSEAYDLLYQILY